MEDIRLELVDTDPQGNLLALVDNLQEQVDRLLQLDILVQGDIQDQRDNLLELVGNLLVVDNHLVVHMDLDSSFSKTLCNFLKI